jgi:CRP-like cAMP-binding protein
MSQNFEALVIAMWRWLDQVRDQEQLRRLELLERVPLFAGLNRRELGRLSIRFYEKAYAADETIFVEGEPGKALFVVLDGRVTIWRAGHAGPEMLASLDPGGYFGELALIDDEPRFASARAEEPSVLLVLYKTEFDHLTEGHSRLAIRVMTNLLKTVAVYVRRAESRQRRHAAVSLPDTPAYDGGKDLP